VKPKTFMLIAGDLAAEQRTAVAHSASYGFVRPHIPKLRQERKKTTIQNSISSAPSGA
jgi:hypothetical protein